MRADARDTVAGRAMDGPNKAAGASSSSVATVRIAPSRLAGETRPWCPCRRAPTTSFRCKWKRRPPVPPRASWPPDPCRWWKWPSAASSSPSRSKVNPTIWPRRRGAGRRTFHGRRCVDDPPASVTQSWPERSRGCRHLADRRACCCRAGADDDHAGACFVCGARRSRHCAAGPAASRPLRDRQHRARRPPRTRRTGSRSAVQVYSHSRERVRPVRAGQRVVLRVDRTGPWVVDVAAAVACGPNCFVTRPLARVS